MSRHHETRPVPARRLFTYRAPRVGSYDVDYGGYCEHPDDPRYVGPSECADCGGTKYDADGNKCPYCNGSGVIYEDES